MGDQLLLGAVLGSTLIPHVPAVPRAAVTPFPPGPEDGSTQTHAQQEHHTDTRVMCTHVDTHVTGTEGSEHSRTELAQHSVLGTACLGGTKVTAPRGTA